MIFLILCYYIVLRGEKLGEFCDDWTFIVVDEDLKVLLMKRILEVSLFMFIPVLVNIL